MIRKLSYKALSRVYSSNFINYKETVKGVLAPMILFWLAADNFTTLESCQMLGFSTEFC